MRKCRYCAEEIQDEAIKCKHCGSDLAEKPAVVIQSNRGIGILLLCLFGIAAIVVSIMVLPDFIQGLNPPVRSAAFNVQFKTAMSALDRYMGSPNSVTKLEARREIDALRNLSSTAVETNIVDVVSNCQFRAEMQNIEPNRKNLEAFRRAYADALSVRY